MYFHLYTLQSLIKIFCVLLVSRVVKGNKSIYLLTDSEQQCHSFHVISFLCCRSKDSQMASDEQSAPNISNMSDLCLSRKSFGS